MILKQTLKNNAGNGNTTTPQQIQLVVYWQHVAAKKPVAK